MGAGDWCGGACLCSFGRLQTQKIMPMFVKLPKQTDDWSCGHRCLLHLRSAFAEGLALRMGDSWAVKSHEMEIPSEATSMGAIVNLCRCWTAASSSMKKEELPRPFVRPAKQEPSLPVNVHPLRPVASPVRSASVPEVAKTGPVKIPVKMEAGAAAVPPTSSKPTPDVPASKSSQPTALNSSNPTPDMGDTGDEGGLQVVVDGLDLFDKHLQERVSDLKASRADMKRMKQARDSAKVICKFAGLSFNEHFQKRHSTRLQKGHWPLFLDGIMTYQSADASSISCEVCRQLLIDFNIPAARDLYEKGQRKENGGKPLPLQPVPCGSEPDTLEDQLSNAMVEYDAEAKVVDGAGPPLKKRRGRPPKGEKVAFNVVDFINEQRAGKYHFLTDDEVSCWGKVLSARFLCDND